MEYTHSQRLALLQVLTLIMRADEIIKPVEIEYLNRFIADFNIQPDDITQADMLSLEQCRLILSQLTSNQKRECLTLFEGMANIDNDYDPREKEIITNLFVD